MEVSHPAIADIYVRRDSKRCLEMTSWGVGRFQNMGASVSKKIYPFQPY